MTTFFRSPSSVAVLLLFSALGAFPLVASVSLRPVPTPSLAELPAEARQKIEQARREVEQAQESQASPGAAFGRLGSYYLHVGLLDAAEVALGNAVAAEPEEIRWRYYLAVCRERRGDLDGARDELRRVLSQRQGNLPSVLRLADLLAFAAEKGGGETSPEQADEARTLYQAALQSPLGIPAGRAGLARLAEQDGDYSAAVLHLEQAIEAQPAATALHRRLSHVLAAAGRQEDAQRQLRLAGEVEVRYPDPLMLQLALELGDPNVELRPAEAGPPAAAEDLLESGSAAFLEGERERGLELLEQAVAEDPGDAEARKRLASALLVLGRLPQAATQLEEAVAIDAGDRSGRLQLAQVYFELRRFDEADGQLGLLLTGPTADAEYEARLLAGQVAAARQDPETAEAHFRRVADSSAAPKGLRARGHFNLGLLRQASRRIEEAVAFYRRALDLDANHRQALFNLGLIMASNNRHEEAADVYQRLFDLQPDNLDVRFRLAVTQMRQGRHWAALGHFEAILKERPDDVDALVSSALLLAEVGQKDQALERLEAASARLDPGPGQAKVLQTLGQLRRETGDQEEALEALRRAVAAFGPETGPAAAGAHLDLARALAQAGRFDDADEHFAAYLEVHADDEDAHFARAMALILGDHDGRARDSLVEVTARLPSVPLTHLLARLLAGSPDPAVRDGERAVDIARTVFERQRNPFHGETLAMALAAAGRMEEAITLQQRLLDEAQAADFDADFIGRVERNLVRYRAGQPGVFGW